MLDRVRWERIASVYDLAIEQDPGERGTFLDEACTGDDALRREVESLLAQDLSTPGVLEDVAENARQVNPVAGSSTSPAHRTLPQTIGRYRILGLIAEGGMGSVYEAEQENPRRTVALKVVRQGWTRPELIRRFQLETEALGRLEHPNIARIYDAGVADQGFGPQPYFAMERIHGVELTEYAATHRLNAAQKLRLLIPICDAVEHAHQRGIVHRDLKPGNILVDQQGQPQILDFGVAHITDVDAAATRRTDLGEIVGTLAYMSPEQVSGDPAELDSRSDVYTLGVLMYELLAGRLPYEVGRKVQDAVRVICDGEIVPLGVTQRALRGDLETIAHKALEKDKRRRYGSAAELAADLRRFLAHEPIQARRPSLAYQARKFAARHRSLAITAAAVFLMLIAGLLATSREAVRASRAERAALIDRDRAVGAEQHANSERDRALRAEASESAQRAQAEGQRNRAQTEKSRADREAATAKTVSDFLRNDLLAQAGARQQAAPNVKPDPNLTVRTALDRAAARVEGRFKNQPEVEAAIHETIGAAYFDLSLMHEADEQYAKAEALRRAALGAEDPRTLETMQFHAEVLRLDGKADQALALVMQVLEARRRTLGEHHPLTLASVSDLAMMISMQRGAHSEAAAYMEKALPLVERVLGQDHEQTLVMASNLAAFAIDSGNYSRAEELLTRVVAARRRVSGADHPSTLLATNSLGVAYRYEGKYAEAEPLLQEALRRRRAIYGDSHLDTLSSMTSLGLLYAAQGRFDQADALVTRSWEVRRTAFGDAHTATLAGLNNLAELREKEGRLDEAERLFADLVEARRKSLSPAHPNLLNAIASLGRVRYRQGKFAEAEPPLEESVDGYGKDDGWRAFYAECLLGANQMELRKYPDAEKHLIAGYAKLSAARHAVPFENRPEIARVRQWIPQLYDAWGKTELAARWRSEQ